MDVFWEFDRLSQLGRKRVLAQYAFESQEKEGMTPALSAKALTQYAIEHHFVGERGAITGETLAAWGDKHYASIKIPLWAVQAAVHYLVYRLEWLPDGEAQWAYVGFVWNRWWPTREMAIEAIPAPMLPYQRKLEHTLMWAKRSRDAFELSQQAKR
ncbi:hypothetical protein [Vibrio mediterranei]|uniref:hypothetical protein n=1 Tax=Vibrio mediterranei TaxID=689 RepID=UPI00148DC277|nr:hypothetical protein [Vibrio mediterranei]NOI26555.1 hypothetical protein [Vibrio mediterranei]